MKDQPKKSMKRMSRIELLELLVAQMEENEQLKKENEDLKAKLEHRKLVLENSGTLAEAALQLTRIFEEADQAIEIYRTSRIEDLKSEKTNPEGFGPHASHGLSFAES